MKLICFGDAGFEKPGVQLDDSTRLDVSEVGREFDESFASDGLGQLQDWIRFTINRCVSEARSVDRARLSVSA
jgi:hypothetical protein